MIDSSERHTAAFLVWMTSLSGRSIQSGHRENIRRSARCYAESTSTLAAGSRPRESCAP